MVYICFYIIDIIRPLLSFCNKNFVKKLIFIQFCIIAAANRVPKKNPMNTNGFLRKFGKNRFSFCTSFCIANSLKIKKGDNCLPRFLSISSKNSSLPFIFILTNEWKKPAFFHYSTFSNKMAIP